ncbi:MAG: ATP-binding protein [Deltaproteobacteria bacterium]|nr:ATP-binding protein [Deltaproteobacteria bacterium]MBI3296334.1 ATP-binding protein [Deltaproteobacteria bacterium]
MIVREFVGLLLKRLNERRAPLQVVLGPRQVGKTFGVEKHLIPKLSGHVHYATADEALTPSVRWIEEQWQHALEKGKGTTLIIDEIQCIENWSKTVKVLWDRQKDADVPPLKCVLLGSSSLSLQKGLSESLTGRFEEVRVPHWGFLETQKAFGWKLPTFLTFGGYPGSYDFINDYARWFSFLKNSVIETVIGKDILNQNRVSKPALFRQAFEILCHYPAQEVSYNKLLGQLQDKGNVDLVKHYLQLYEGAFLFRSLHKYAKRGIAARTSSPKIIPLCPAISTLALGRTPTPELQGRMFEAAVGSQLIGVPSSRLYYWREGRDEVDYILESEGRVFSIEVKSSKRELRAGATQFRKKFRGSRSIVIHPKNFEEFCSDSLNFLEKCSV